MKGVAYLSLFITVGFLFVLGSLLLGSFLRSHNPSPQKNETYECGEPSIGPGNVQFDLRFYVVALLFLIFEVEVAFFFPPATIFGQANHQRAEAVTNMRCAESGEKVGAHSPSMSCESAQTLSVASMLDLGVFFAVLLVGFAYIWRCGDLDWVRAVGHPQVSAERTSFARRPGGERER
jgi:NADH-quinone oxidoreductase subunit A